MDKVKIILAKFWVAIVCGVIALLAIGASFWPLGEYHKELHEELQTSANSYDTANSLLNKQRNLPLSPGQQTPSALKQFPSPTIIKSGEELRDKLNKESLNAVAVVVGINAHKPLLPGVLPNPQGTAPLDYRAAYVQRVGSNGTLFKTVLQAGLPPTTADIKDEGDNLWKSKYEPMIVKDGTGKAFNDDSVKAQYDRDLLLLPAQMRQERALACKLYAANDALPIDPVVAQLSGLPPDPRKIWWSQMELWISEDVAQAIADANMPAKDVTASAVKRLLKLDVPGPDQSMIVSTNRALTAFGPEATVVAPAALPEVNAPVPLDFKLSPSGRTSCPMYDVVQFRIEMVVAAKDIPWILECLVRNKLISVLNVESIVAENVSVAEKDGFFYGPLPVVRIKLQCEALFLREWTGPLMPDTIKRLLATMTTAG